jgi:hypothetical protein
MASESFKSFQNNISRQLDRLRDVHGTLTKGKAGRPLSKLATQQVIDAYIVLLSGVFQLYCRDVYQEALDVLVGHVGLPRLEAALYRNFQWGLELESRNAQPGSLGSDFGRLGMDLWTRLYSIDRRNRGRKAKLDALNVWRNAIAHQNFDFETVSADGPKADRDRAAKAGATKRTLSQAMDWRAAMSGLAADIDRSVSAHLTWMLRLPAAPW